MTQEWISIDRASDRLGVSASTIRRRIKQGIMPSKLQGNRRLVLVQTDTPVDIQVTQSGADTVTRLESEVEFLRSQVTELQQRLKEKDDQSEQSKERSDTIILQLTRQLDQSQRLLEYHQEPFWKRWFRRDKFGNED